MSENNTPDPETQAPAKSDASSSRRATPFLSLNSSPPEVEGDALMRATDTPMESSPAPTGVTIESGRKRKYAGDEDDEDMVGNKSKKRKGKGKKVGTGKSVRLTSSLSL